MRYTFYFLLPMMLLLAQVPCTAAHKPSERDDAGTFQNIILLIPDGCGVAHMTIARWCKGKPLAQDSMKVALVRTWCANSMITGSAAAATAMATGHKTWEEKGSVRCISMVADSQLIPAPRSIDRKKKWRPAATVLELAKRKGKAVGLVATSRVSHATPAAFAGHWHNRECESVLMKQLVYQGVDVVFGGGRRFLVDASMTVPGTRNKGMRRDGADLYAELEAQGVRIISTQQQLAALPQTPGRVWGLFAPGHLEHDLDRPAFSPSEPSLEEMTRAAITLLSRNRNGFFLMVEGSQIDWSSHDNDPTGVVTEYLAFDKAVDACLSFAKKDGSTLVLMVPDHDNGGMSLGDRNPDHARWLPDTLRRVLKRPVLTAEGVQRKLIEAVDRASPDRRAIQKIVARFYGLDKLDTHEVALLVQEFADTLKRDEYGRLEKDSLGDPVVNFKQMNFRELLGPMLSTRARIGWTRFDHTGNDVPLFYYGIEEVPGLMDNTDIARICERALGGSLDSLSEELFVDAKKLFPNAGIAIDTANVMFGGGQVRVASGGREIAFPFSTNLAVVRRDTVRLPGIVVYSYLSGRCHVPRQAKALLAGAGTEGNGTVKGKKGSKKVRKGAKP
ncbi:MAG: alkaline phosphatase [Chitinispirillaceae bacterium]|nr:alkaline phosphatase [Chitinispirillaceae bacterium]